MLPPPAKMLQLAVCGEFSLKGSFVSKGSARTNAFLLRGELPTRRRVKQRRGRAHPASLLVGAGRLAATSGGDASPGDDTRCVCERASPSCQEATEWHPSRAAEPVAAEGCQSSGSPECWAMTSRVRSRNLTISRSLVDSLPSASRAG